MSTDTESYSSRARLIPPVAPSTFDSATRRTNITYPPTAHCHTPVNNTPQGTPPIHTPNTPRSSHRTRRFRSCHCDWGTIILGTPVILVFLAISAGAGILICLLSLSIGSHLLRNHIHVAVTQTTWLAISASGNILGILHLGPIVAGIKMYPHVKSLRLWAILIVLLWQPIMIVHAVAGVSIYREANKPPKGAVVAIASLGGFITTLIFTTIFALFLQCHRMSRGAAE